MKAKFVCLVLFSAAFGLLLSAPLRDVETVLEQPDGSSYACKMSGDEYYHRAHDANGYTIIKDPETGWHVYAQKQGAQLVPTQYVPGRDDPAARGLAPNLLPDPSVLRTRFQNWRGTSTRNYGRAPTIGTIENLVIFVRFAGEPEFGQNIQNYDYMHNSLAQASMKGYFLEESAGQLAVNSSFYPSQPGGMLVSWMDPNPRNYYYPQSAGNPVGYPPGPPTDPDQIGYIRLHTMMVNAVNSIAPMVAPTLNIDADNDLKVDNLSFICKGNADATSAIFWPHFWQMNAYPATPVTQIMYNGQPRMAEDYNFSMQFQDPLYTGYGGGIDTAEIAHEFSHTLGFPDLYHYSWDGVNPCGYWDLMDYCYQVPQHHLVYQKWRYGGWCPPPQNLPPIGPYTLTAVSSSPFSCYMQQMPNNEQIWIEYRQQAGLYESRVPGSGLIIYRVRPNLYPWGNAGGPPDEVYVYRPFVSAMPPDGNINAAHFAWDAGRTAMNMYTDPAPFSQAMPGVIYSTFNIHSIGSSLMTGPQISFDTSSQIPVIWTGAMDNNWFNPSNWSTGAVPTATDFAIVTQGMFNCTVPFQIIPPGFVVPAVCQQLRVEHQLNVLLNAHLQVGGHCYSIGRIFMDGNQMQVTGKLTIDNWYAGSWFQCTSNNLAQIIVGSDCLFANNANIQLTAGQLIFANLAATPPSNTFTCDAITAILHDLTVSKQNCTLIMDSILPFPPIFIQGDLTLNTGAANGTTLNINSPRPISVSGNINVTSNCILQVTDPNNMISMVGPPSLQTIFTPNPASYFHHLDINNNANPLLSSNIDVHGNLYINMGGLIAGPNTIFLHGNWVDNMGAGAFQKGTSRVSFCGASGDQIVQMSSPSGANLADFHILEINKSSGSFALSTPGLQVQCDAYDWTAGMLKVSDGMFTAFSLADGYLAGSITCNAPGIINFTDNTGMGDLNANLSIQGGSFNVHCPSAGPGSFALWGAQPVSITMSSGQIVYHDVGIHIVPGPSFNTSITGGTIDSAGDFLIHNSGFTPTGGMVRIYNPGLGTVSQIGTAPGSHFYDLILQSNADALMPLQVNGNMNIDPSVVCNINSLMNVVGTLMLNGTMNCIGPISVTLGSLVLPASGVLNVNNATLTVLGSSRAVWNGTVNIGDGWLDATNHVINLSPTGAINFGTPGPGINGKLSCANLNLDPSLAFTPSVGTLELSNTDPLAVFAFGLPVGSWVHNLDIDILSSVQLMTDLSVNGDLHIISGQLIMDNSGRTISLQGNWINDLPLSGFVRANSTVDFTGTSISTITAGGGTEQFHKLRVQGATVVLNDDVAVHDLLDILIGSLQTGTNILSASANVQVFSGGSLSLGPGSVLELGNTRQIIVQSGAVFQSLGSSGNPAVLRGQSGAKWMLNALSGSNIAVSYTDFFDLRSTGVTILNGAVVDMSNDFDNCSFQTGAANVSYLTINNSQDLSISGISFSSPVSGGYNIAKTVNAGSVSVTSSSGDFAGPLYENDPNALIGWMGYAPNLIVQAFAVSNDNPYVADQVSYSFTVKNDSAHPVQGSFKVHLFKDRSSAPGWNESGDLEITCPSLNPGATYSNSFSGVYSMSAGGWTSWLLIDPEAAVSETDETDNRASDTLTWQSLPAVSAPSVTQTGTSTARITWSYSLWVSRYKIYWSSDPYSSFSYLDSTTNPYYDIPLDQSTRFFTIQAERDAPAK